MEMIFTKRGEGKTTKLICMSYLNNVPIVVNTSKQAYCVKSIADRMGLEIPEPIVGYDATFLGFEFRGKKVSEVYVDDAEYLFKSLFESAYGVKLGAFSMSINDTIK